MRERYEADLAACLTRNERRKVRKAWCQRLRRKTTYTPRKAVRRIYV